MSLGLWPDAVPYDPDSGTALDALRRQFDAEHLPAALLLVCARNLRDSPWTPRAAIGLARALVGGARAVVLADVDFERPTLHEALGEANGEGLADALLFGASLERVTLEPAGEQFEFVPCGAFAPDPPELMSHPGWARILAELAARNALLLAYAPLGMPGLDALADRITSVIVLAGDMEMAPTVALLPETIRVEGVIRPAAPPPPPAVATPTPEPVVAAPAPPAPPAPPQPLVREPLSPIAAEAEPVKLPKDEAREALLAELRARQKSAAPGNGGETPVVQTPRPEPVVMATPRQATPSGVPGRRLWTIAILLVVVTLASWFIGKLLAGGRENPDAGTTAGNNDGDSPAQPAGVILGFSVALESYEQLPLAVARADSLATLDSALTFYIAPVRMEETIYYRVMAGPLPDSQSARGALRTLVERGYKAAASDNDVRETPLAFLLGQFAQRDSAVSRRNELKGKNVPSYIVEVPYTTGPNRYHLYAGAYAAPSEAEAMRGVLRSAGLLDTLVLRLGRNP